MKRLPLQTLRYRNVCRNKRRLSMNNFVREVLEGTVSDESQLFNSTFYRVNSIEKGLYYCSGNVKTVSSS